MSSNWYITQYSVTVEAKMLFIFLFWQIYLH